jgi:gamma-glutamyltranspeptidase/glutathione hydrolase
LQQLALLKGFDLDGLDPVGPEFIHLQVEAAKLAFADRDSFYGDPTSSKLPSRFCCRMPTTPSAAL